MSRKTRLPDQAELLLDVPRGSDRFVPVPERVKFSVCHLCDQWTVRRDGKVSVTDERRISGFLRKGSIRYRSHRSLDGRPFCENCELAQFQMDDKAPDMKEVENG